MHAFRLPLLTGVESLRHVFVGRGPAPRPEPPALLRELMEGADHRPATLARARQVHSNRCLLVDGQTAMPEGIVGDGDALATSAGGIALGVATADCLPLILVDPVSRALGVVHAGWRGTVAGVLTASLDLMREKLDARPERIVIGAGPAVGACCYRVGAEVVEAFERAYPAHINMIVGRPAPGVTHLDLLGANRLQAQDAGVDLGRFESLDLCTVCRPEQTHSYRRQGSSAGRMWALAMLID
jgi:YfiH family protein